MKTLCVVLLLVGASSFAADTWSLDPGNLYAGLIRMTEEGRSETARAILQTLVNRYGKNPETEATQHAIDAGLLFEDGQARLIAGKYGTARLAFQTLISVYPESPLAKRAAEGVRAAEELDQTESGPVVRSLRFESIHPVKVQDILERFKEREIALDIEKPYDAKAVEQARTVLTELLVERGMPNARVQVSTRDIPPRRIEITFRVSKDQ